MRTAANGLDNGRPDRTRWSEVRREAGRNLVSGTTRGGLATLVFVVLAGGLALVDTRAVIDLAQRAAAFRATGAAVTIVQLENGIDGAQCDALTGSPGVAASGALRDGGSLRLAVLPTRNFETFEASPGLAGVLRVSSPGQGMGATVSAGGIWISSEIADSLGLSSTPADVPILPDGETHVSGTFPYPNDGRDPLLGYSILAPVPAAGTFDACWVEVWPDPDLSTELLLLPVLAVPGGTGDPAPRPEIRQLNTTLGSRLQADATVGALPWWVSPCAAATIGVTLGLGLMRLRRLELAAALHAGVSRVTLAHQLSLETVGWLAPALAVTVPMLLWVARLHNPGGVWPALFPGMRVILLAAILAFVGTVVGALRTQERHLFRYFKAR